LGEMFGAGRGAHCARPPSAAGGRRSLCFAQRLRGIRRQDASGGEMFGARRRAHRAQDDTSADSENLRPADAGVCASRQPDASRVFQRPACDGGALTKSLGCGDAHTASCVRVWCLIAQPLGRGWVCVCRRARRPRRRRRGWLACTAGGGGNFDQYSVSRGLSGMVRVSDVPHRTKSAGTTPPHNSLSACTSCKYASACVCAWACAGMRVRMRVRRIART